MGTRPNSCFDCPESTYFRGDEYGSVFKLIEKKPRYNIIYFWLGKIKWNKTIRLVRYQTLGSVTFSLFWNSVFIIPALASPRGQPSLSPPNGLERTTVHPCRSSSTTASNPSSPRHRPQELNPSRSPLCVQYSHPVLPKRYASRNSWQRS
jgi:hypothetical protein